ncbi:MAG: hypothetical protein JST30_08025 [Armatimonadetes bacterium]|nr:hypothetical protein [Armatimonadota bacterium]
MTKTATLALVTILALGAAGTAQAQYSKPLGLSVRIGLFYPSNGEARDVEGQGWFAGGIEYKGGDLKFGTGTNAKYSAMWTASLDYYGKGSYSNAPLLLNYVGRMDQVYYTAGAGVGFGHVAKTGGGSTSDTEFAFQLGVGYDFVKMATPFFVELKYFGSSESRLTGFGVYGGVRF